MVRKIKCLYPDQKHIYVKKTNNQQPTTEYILNVVFNEINF